MIVFVTETLAVYYSPFFAHILEGWARKDDANVLFLFYEDMKRDLRGEMNKVCAFLDKTASEEQMQMLLKHLHFDSMANNRFVNEEGLKEIQLTDKGLNFMRKGKTGDWKNHFNPEMNRRLDEWIHKSLEASDLKFTMELDHQD